MQTKPRRTVLGFRLLTVVIGLLLLLIIGLYSIRTDNFEGEQNFASRVDYIKDQCDDYTSLSLAAESKSMLRIAEACEQCARDIQTGTDAVEAEVLSRCAENHYLTGAAVLDRDGNVVQYFSKEGALPQQLLQELATAPLLDVAAHPKKTYSVRLVCDDDSYLDLAASARTDADGIVAAFYHTPTDYVHSYNLNCQHLLAGFTLPGDGTLVVARGDSIIASNDESLLGLAPDAVLPLQLLREHGRFDQMVYVRDATIRSRGYFGLRHAGARLLCLRLPARGHDLHQDHQKPDVYLGGLSAHRADDRAGAPPHAAELSAGKSPAGARLSGLARAGRPPGRGLPTSPRPSSCSG